VRYQRKNVRRLASLAHRRDLDITVTPYEADV
jgi:hypothetical protein